MRRFWLVSEHQTGWEARYYFTLPRHLRQEFAQHYAIAFNRDTLIEDNNACTRQQVALKSGAVRSIQLGMQEMACRHNAPVVKAAVDQLQALSAASE